jgi:phospholipase C
MQLARLFPLLALSLGLALLAPPARGQRGLDRIGHVVVIFLENWSFDGLFGKFPGATGIAQAGATVRQVDRAGQPYAQLPPPLLVTYTKPTVPDPRFPAGRPLPVAPFDLAPYVPPDQKTGDLVHRWYQQQYQINGGRMDKFVAWSDAGGLVMSYYDATTMPLGELAREGTLCDRFFHSAFGGSWLNHIWLIAAQMPRWPNAPPSMVAKLDAAGVMVEDGEVSPDGYVINDVFTVNRPHPAATPRDQLLPDLTFPTIGDRLTGKGVSWAWYSGGWNDALAGRANPTFSFEHQPFAYFANYADGKPAKASHLKDEADFFRACETNTLPAVSFVKPIGADDMHPGISVPLRGMRHARRLVEAVRRSRAWADSVVIVTFDENGGRWDSLPPPVIDRFGPGTRVPAIILGPFAKKGFVDPTRHETVSVLKLIEARWRLAPLAARDAAASDLTSALSL